MNTKRYYEIEQDPVLNDKQKNKLHDVERLKEIIDFWKGKQNVADYHIKQNEEKIRKILVKLGKGFYK
jgi:hypothetical protein